MVKTVIDYVKCDLFFKILSELHISVFIDIYNFFLNNIHKLLFVINILNLLNYYIF